ncbi:hypothetical protein ACFROC_00435, partial [Nocardia tengchongensis]|uniref:hypothetical protein n=1 Tax=Nocardia tengchongensis TaxID=2055889 RepID=UPI0036AFF96B
CGALLLAFAARLAIAIVRSALDSVYHGLMSIFGFAAGGFIYGPTQTFLIRSLVHGFFAAARMAAEIVFLALYLLLLGDLFEQARGQVMTVFVIGAIVEVIAISQLKRLGEGLERGNDWVANRFALAAQAGGGAGGGGSALGMGAHGARQHLGALGTLGAVNTVASFPGTEWVAGKTRSFLRPYSRMERRMNLQLMTNSDRFAEEARRGGQAHDGLATARGVAAAALFATRAGAGIGALPGALAVAGVKNKELRDRVVNSWALAAAGAGDTPFGQTAAAARRAQGNLNLLMSGKGNRGTSADLEADVAVMQASALHFRQTYNNGVSLHGRAEEFVTEYMRSPSRERAKALGHIAAGTEPGNSEHDDVLSHYLDLTSAGVTADHARQMWSAIGNRHAMAVSNAADALDPNRPDPLLLRRANLELAKAQQTDEWTPSGMPSAWKTLVDGVNSRMAGQKP